MFEIVQNCIRAKRRRLTCCIRRAPRLLTVLNVLSASCLSLFAGSFELPAITVPPPATNTYHLTFAFEPVSNATWYAVVVKTNGVESFRRYSMTNLVIVSNLSGNLDQYQFTAIATNSIGESDQSQPAATKWMNVLESDSLAGPWSMLATNSFVPAAPQHFIALSNWNASAALKPD